MAIVKGTADYKKAQEMANEIIREAETSKRYNASYFDIAFGRIGQLVAKIENLDTFASNIANTIESTMNPYGYQVARISSKQAWIIACAAVENNIEF